MEDLQAEQEQGTQALSGVARQSSTCSSSICLREASKISRERSKGGSKVFVEETKDSSGKISKTKEVVREERK